MPEFRQNLEGKPVRRQTKPACQITNMRKGTRRILLTQGKYAIVDAIDYEWLMQWRWYAERSKRKRCEDQWYARTKVTTNGNTIAFRMHQEIAKRSNLPKSQTYDHRDHNGLNNQRENIRPATKSQNAANGRKIKGTTSRFKGVCWFKPTKMWSATIHLNGHKISLGYFHSEHDAGMAYIKSAKKMFGEFMCTA